MKKSFKIFISTVLVLVLMMTVAFAVPGRESAPGQLKKDNLETEFNDMTGHWALAAVQNLTAMGKIKGVGNGKFAPANAAKQIEVLVMTLRHLELENKLDQDAILPPAFKGTKPNEWMIPYLDLAIDEKLLTVEELADFNPNKSASRSWTAVIIVRALGKVTDALKLQDTPLPYKDAAAVPEDRIGYVNYVTREGLMIGHNDNFQPNKTLSRAEMAQLFDNLDKTNRHKVTFSIENEPDFVRYYSDGQIIALPEINRTGYTLDGWYTNQALTAKANTSFEVKGPATFFAKWTINEYTITFDKNNGTTETAIKVEYNKKITEPANPEKEGFSFGGWFTDSKLRNKDKVIFDDYYVTKDVTLYAKWIKE